MIKNVAPQTLGLRRPEILLEKLPGNILFAIIIIQSFIFILCSNESWFLYIFLFLIITTKLFEKEIFKGLSAKLKSTLLTPFICKQIEILFYSRIFILTVFIAIITLAHVKYFLIQPFRVNQKSMLPEIKPGDLVLIEKISMGLIINYYDKDNFVRRLSLPWNRPLQSGDIIIFRKPLSSDLLIKRIERIENHKYYVLGDNRENSVDSRFFGFIPENKIIGRLILNFQNNNLTHALYLENIATEPNEAPLLSY